MNVLITALSLLIFGGHSIADLPECPSDFAKFRHDDTCSKWWECSWRIPSVKSCPDNLVWSKQLGVCVETSSDYNDCTLTEYPPTIEERCANGETLIPHQTECARFYNCSLIRDLPSPVPTYFGEQHLDECRYPFLFNSAHKFCAWFSTVDCGTRNEPIDACQYLRYQCPVSHCAPCGVNFPSCRNKANGINEFTGKEGSSWFMYCLDEHFLPGSAFQCPRGMIFSGTQKACVTAP